MRLDQLPFNWFDLAVVAILFFGFTRGRKHGMSEEMMYLGQWIAIMFGANYAYQPFGEFLSLTASMSRLVGYVVAYILTVIGIKILFSLIKRAVGGKLVGSNLFGAAEYYLGMVAGILRFACIIMCALALLNARYYNQEEIRVMKKYQDDVYGSNFFPGLHDIQASVFDKAFLGRQVRNRLPMMLIKPTAPEKKELRRAGEFELR
jgi:uncharacterized membrane protein required for colicin V production